MITHNTKCKECGGSSLSWDSMPRNKSNVVEGRLKTNEVTVDFFLGCDDCSATVRVVTANEMVQMLNRDMAVAAQPS